MIKLRFVTGDDIFSWAIRRAEDFGFSHVEAVTLDGKYLGAHADGGVQARPSDYDKGQFTKEVFVSLSVPDEISKVFYNYLNGKVGTPYDYEAILGFVSRLDEHQTGMVICSALMTLGLRHCKYFPFPLVVPAHEISPRDLMLTLSGRVKINLEN